jgi:hypothetical protein
MTKKDKYKSLELSGAELDNFIKKLADKLYEQVWANTAIGTDELIIKENLKQSIVLALKEYAEYRSDE